MYEEKSGKIDFNTIEAWKKHLGSLWSKGYFSLMKMENLVNTCSEHVERAVVSSSLLEATYRSDI